MSFFYIPAETADAGGGGGVTAHGDLTGRDSTNQHAIAAIVGLQAALDGKAATSHNHDGTYSPAAHNHDGVYQPAGSYAAASHSHGVDNLTATGTKDSTTFLRGDNTWAVPPGGGGGGGGVSAHSELTGRDASDQHPTSAITGLDAALAGKAATSHNHDGTYSPAAHNHDGTYAPAVHGHVDLATTTYVDDSVNNLAIASAEDYEAKGLAATLDSNHVAATNPHNQYAQVMIWDGTAWVASTDRKIWVGRTGATDPTALMGENDIYVR